MSCLLSSLLLSVPYSPSCIKAPLPMFKVSQAVGHSLRSLTTHASSVLSSSRNAGVTYSSLEGAAHLGKRREKRMFRSNLWNSGAKRKNCIVLEEENDQSVHSQPPTSHATNRSLTSSTTSYSSMSSKKLHVRIVSSVQDQDGHWRLM